MNITIETTDKDLSSLAGMLIFKKLCEKAYPEDIFDNNNIPSLKSGIDKNIVKLKQLIYAFQAGAECLDDFNRLAMDSSFRAICDDRVYTPKSMGNFLRTFDQIKCKNLNSLLSRTSFRLRSSLFPTAESIIFDIDSTSNQQYGKKMEGVNMNYKGFKSLDTIQVFDERGIQYWNEVRSGNTHTAKGSQEIIHKVFAEIPEEIKSLRKFVRADSGYCTKSFFDACTVKDSEFVICMRKLMYRPLIKMVSAWEKQDTSEPSRVIFVGGRECEIGETVYRPKNSHHEFRVIILRAVKPASLNKLILEESDYDYQGWVSNICESMSAEEVIKLYRKRGHCENFIRELKNGLDLHHYPCQKLLANKAFGIIAALSYNLMRFVSLKDNPTNPKFAKAIRFKFVHIPCQVVRHARKVTFRFMNSHFKEVSKWLEEFSRMKVGLPLVAT
ncbi:IS1380 family transposase [Pseudobacteriovorax antillogorgiicola]|uniref:Transposase DDE domain group 1 n=2 Tax=Pseudobacteriovorax antillogorgiicola TaxID=1513793 RepID=A0A1Y6CRA8_9BACT|nr:IS1380 family transposase [Pseudobacteriovorax antillogorgiicola]TCS40288.1 DDE family transposase [Pseudobacteriovorax antillogorgiicola]SMF84829.1 Transposase DDE domain group 1 [Pseudobacteriovorax antillogorgiicola]